jgi:uncharacterized protein
MLRQVTRYVALLFLGLFAPLAALQASAQAVKDLPRPTDYVSDDAHVLSPQVTQQLDMLCGQVDRQAHAQIAVLTVNDIGDEAIADYAVELEDEWKVGPKGTDRGVIVLLAVKDHKRFIETGYGLEGILPDGKVGEIGREMVPYLRANNYDAAVSLAVNQISGIIAQDAGVTLQQRPVRRGAQPQQVQLSLGQIIVGGLVLLFLLFVAARTGILPFLIGMFLGGGFRGGGRGGDGGDGGGDGFGGFGGGSTGGGGAGGDW